MNRKLTQRKQVLFFTLLCCLVYFMSYLTRLNYAAGLAEIRISLNISKQLASLPVTGCFITYGIGQFICGILGDRISPRIMICAGLAATSLCNLMVSFTQSISVLTVFWCLNGFFQSMLWPPLVRIMAENLNEVDYQNCCVHVSIASSIGTITVYLLTPVCIALSGWRSIFLLPAVLGLAMAAVWFVGIGKIHPDSNAVRETAADPSEETPSMDLKTLIKRSALISIQCAIILHGILRDGITTWMPTYITEIFGMSTSFSILTTAILPLFSIFSITLASMILKRLRNELLVASLLFSVGAVSCAILLPFYQSSPVISITMMTLITGCMHGINLMLISRVPKHFARFGRVSTVSGLLNASTYVGSALSTYAFAALSERFGWFTTIAVWLAVALGGLSFCVPKIRKWAGFREKEKYPFQ